MENNTAAAKLTTLETRASLAPAYPGPAAECVQYAKGVIGSEMVTVYLIDFGRKVRYETYTEGTRTLTRAEVLAAVA
jgi:hypothetical protein